LGAAKIATKKVIPAMQAGSLATVTAIASRTLARAQEAAAELGLAKAYGSYEELLADPDIDAVYNPLPNHLHVPWSIRAAEAGKHVLCEKPIGLSTAEARELIAARDRCGVKIGEAFMVRTHPQWLRAREHVQSGALGPVRAIQCAFSYFNADPANIRNVAAWGGGGLMDIGCYPIQISRFLLGEEPRRVMGSIERDPVFHTDRLVSAVLDFPNVQSSFLCSTQLVPYQRVHVFGTQARLEVRIPFNAIPQRGMQLILDDGSDLEGAAARVETVEPCDQYTIQGDLFSRAILDGTEVPTPLEDSFRNMAVIEAILRSAESGRWQKPETA
jgi:predicted dehydrogenase